MAKFCKLTWILLKTGMPATGLMNRKSGNTAKVVLYIFLGICCIPLIGMLFGAGFGGYHLLAPYGQEGTVIELVCTAGSLVTLVFGIMMIMSIFYMSTDVFHLLALPLRPWQIVASKFTVVLLYEVLTNVILLGPVFLGFGIAAKAGILYWLFVLIALVFVSVVPLVYASILIMLVMRIFKSFKNKDFINVIATLLIVVFVIGINAFSSNLDTVSNQDMINMLQQGKNSLVGITHSIFPTLPFLARGISESSILNMLIFLGLSAAFMLVFILLAEKLYFKGVMGMTETTAKRRKLSEKDQSRMIRSSGAVRSYVGKEIKLILRTPVYLLNCVLIAFIWPIILVIPIITQMSSYGGFGSLIEDLTNDASSWFALMGSQEKSFVVAVVVLIAFGVTCFFSSMTYVSGTAISREGKGFIFMKYIPLSYKHQLKAKLISGLILSSLPTTGYIFIILALMVALMGFPFEMLLFSLAASILAIFLMNCIQLLIDVIRPRLDWQTEQQAVKQNTTILLSTAAGIGLMLVLGGLAMVVYIVAMMLNLPIYAVVIIALLLLVLVDAGIYFLLMGVGEKKLRDLE